METIGRNIFTLRLFESIIIGIGVLFSFLLFYNVGDLKTSLLSAILLTSFPFYIANSNDFYPFEAFLFIVTVYLFIGYAKLGKEKYLYLFSLISGFAIANNLTFVFILPSIFMATIAVKKNMFSRTLEIGRDKRLLVLCLFLVGLTPIIIPTLSLAKDGKVGKEMLDPTIKIFHENRYPKTIFTLNNIYPPGIISENMLLVYIVVIMLSSVGWIIRIKRGKGDWHFFILVFLLTYLIIFNFFPWPTSKDKNILRLISPMTLFPFVLVSGLYSIKVNRRVGKVIFIVSILAILSINLIGLYNLNDFLSNKERVETINSRISSIHSKPEKYIENNSSVYGIFWLQKRSAVKSDSKFDSFFSSESDSKFRAKVKKLLSNLNTEVEEGKKVFLILPSEDWNKTGTKQVLFYCLERKYEGKSICNYIPRKIRKFSTKNEIQLREVRRVRALNGFDVYVVYRLYKTDD